MNKKWIGIGGVALTLVIAATALKTGQKPMAVELTTAVNGEIEQYVEEIGEIQLDERLGLYNVASGVVNHVYVSVGDTVKKGQLLAQMDYQSAELQKKDLAAQAQGVNAQYQEAKKPVKASEITRLTTQLKSAQLLYDEAKRNLADNEALYKAGAIAESAYRTLVVELSNKEVNLQNAKSSLSAAQEGLSVNLKNQYKAQLAEIDSRIELLDKQLKDLGITALADGVVLTRNVESGQYVQPGKMLFEIGSGGKLHLSCDLLFEDLAGLQVGTQVRIENEDLGIKNLKGTVSKIYPIAFSKVSDLGINQKRVTVKVALEGDLKTLKPGYELTAKFITQKRENTIFVDKKALFEYEGKDSLFVNENGKAKLRVVERGLENTDLVEIVSGLQAGEEVILSPSEDLEEGMAVVKE